jgi:hypothetical protein
MTTQVSPHDNNIRSHPLIGWVRFCNAQISWAGYYNPLGLFLYQSFVEADFNQYLQDYMYIDWKKETWAFYDFGNPIPNSLPHISNLSLLLIERLFER